MRKKSKKIIIISIIIFLIVLLLGGLAFTYFATDTFKSNKYLFSKYISQSKEITQIFEDEDIQAYRNRQNLTTYSSKGTIKANVVFPDNSDQSMINALQNCKITLETNVDKPHNYMYGRIKTNYSDAQTLDTEIFRDNDIYAIKINDVVNKYIGIENNNLQEFARKMGIDEETLASIPVKIDLSQIGISDISNNEEMKQITEKYWQIIVNDLTDDMFSKEDFGDGKVYTLKMTEEQIKKVIQDICKVLKDDEDVWQKIKTYLANNIKLPENTVNEVINTIKQEVQKISENTNVFENTGEIDDSIIGRAQASREALEDAKAREQELLNSVDRNVNSNEFEEAEVLSETNSNVGGNNNSINEFEDAQVTEDAELNTQKKITEFKLKVYVSHKKLNKIEVIASNGIENEEVKLGLTKSEDGLRVEALYKEKQFSANFQKIKSENSVKYELTGAEDTNQLFDLNVNFDGIKTDEVSESAELNFEYDISGTNSGKTKFGYVYTNTKTFGTDFEKVNKEGNLLLLNTAPNKEAIQKLLTQIAARFEQVNTEKMKAAGLEKLSSNPFMYYIPAVVPVEVLMSISDSKMMPILPATAIAGVGLFTLNSKNSVMENASISLKEQTNSEERDKITLMLTDRSTIMYQELYVDKTRKKEGITKKDLEKGLKEKNIDATVVENKDKTYTITVKQTQNKYNINEKGKIISYEYANK